MEPCFVYIVVYIVLYIIVYIVCVVCVLLLLLILIMSVLLLKGGGGAWVEFYVLALVRVGFPPGGGTFTTIGLGIMCMCWWEGDSPGH